MDPATLALLSAGGSLMNNAADIGSTILTNQANKRENEATRQFNLKLWNMQNDYNTPKNQMARLAAAGLNPNLVYGSGSASVGNASPPAAASPVNYRAPNIDLPSVVNVLAQIQAIQNMRQKNQTEVWKSASAEQDYDMKAAINSWALAPYTRNNDEYNGNNIWMQKQADLQNKMQALKLSQQLTRLRNQEADMNSQLKEWNLTAADNWIARILVNLGNKSGWIQKFLTPNLRNYRTP